MEDTISILRGLKERYEVFHTASEINDSALIAAATLSDRYITDRFLPDKAIDLVDEACAMIKTEMESMPSEMDDLAHKITQLQIEQVSLKKETDALSQSRLKDIEKELAELQDKFRQMKAQWENEKNAISKVQSLREQIEQTNAAIEKAQREYDLNKAAELKYGPPARAAEAAGRRRKAGRRKEGGQPAAGPRHRRGDRPHRGPLGPASRWKSWWRASGRSCCIWPTCCISGSSARTRPSPR